MLKLMFIARMFNVMLNIKSRNKTIENSNTMLSPQTPCLINWFVWIVRTADSVDARLCVRVSEEGAGSVRLVHGIAALMGSHRSTAAISITV